VVVGTDGKGYVVAKWFNADYLRNVFKKGLVVCLSGKIDFYDTLQMLHPEYEILDEYDKELLHTGRIVPLYPLVEGLSQKVLRRIVHTALGYIHLLQETLSGDVIAKARLMGLREAISELHFPTSMDRIESARRRLIFEELFYLQLLFALKKKHTKKTLGISFKKDKHPLVTKLLSNLNFELTSAQLRVLSEIRKDMESPYPMNRLLQGDVGSGKTIVALISMLMAVECGCQSALLAPTEILAYQHFSVLRNYLEPVGVRYGILVGGMKKKRKERMVELLAKGDIDIVVGTHALIEEKVQFANLGFVVIDEQHRFGVLQRAAMRQKGVNPDVLVMTATPIPRSLSLVLYGDLDVSIIDKLPPGRKPVVTRWVMDDKRESVYGFVREKIEQGEQAYIVVPLVEESEKLDVLSAEEMYERLTKGLLKEIPLGMVHGRMDYTQREEVMSAFRRGDIKALVATTVIEVGVDVPQATLMVIEHAERFGLSQLHQLRGRVGRGTEKSYCVLITPRDITDEARERLEMMVRTNDGFKIAEKDLAIRGPGEFFGTRQHGLPELRFADLIKHRDILKEARKIAFWIIEGDPQLLARRHTVLREIVFNVFKAKLDLAEVG